MVPKGPTKGQTMSPIELLWTAKNQSDMFRNYLDLMRFTILRSGYEVVEYGGGHRDSNKMVIEGLEGDDLSPEGELLCNCSTHNGERIE